MQAEPLHAHGRDSMPRRKVATTVYLTAEQDSDLKMLHQQIKVPVAELVRQGVDLVLQQYDERLPEFGVKTGGGRSSGGGQR